MQSSCYGWSTTVANSVHNNIYAEIDDSPAERYPTDVKDSRGSNPACHTEEVWLVVLRYVKCKQHRLGFVLETSFLFPTPITVPITVAVCEMQTASSRICTRDVVSISHTDNRYIRYVLNLLNSV